MHGRDLLISLKAAAGRPGPQLSLPVADRALLRPVATREEFLNPADIRCLTEWRNKFVTSFLNEFNATEKQTAAWLVNVVGKNDSKILFMADDLTGKTFAYLGLAFIDWNTSSGEADAIVRGGNAPAGTMTLALRTLVDWARGQLGLKTIGVRVRSDNSALEFYRKFGFVEKSRQTLRKTTNDATVRWIEDSSATDGPALVHMLLP